MSEKVEVKVWTDGSYSTINGVGIYGGASLIYMGDNPTPMQCKWADHDTNWSRFRNISGELLAVVKTLGILVKFKDNIERVIIFHDQKGVSAFLTGEYKSKRACSRVYVKMMEEYQKELKISFIEVKAHTGVANNELVDKLAKEAVKEHARSLQSANQPQG